MLGIRKSLVAKVALSLGALGAAASIAGLGTFATFTASATAGPQQITTGTVTLAVGATGASTNRLNINASGVAAGDTIQRSVDLINNGGDLGAITLTTSASPSSVLDTDVVNGLQMVIDKCSVAWTEAGTAPAYTYTCSGTTTSVLVSRAVIGSNLALTNLGATTSGTTDHLRLTLSLPSAADNTFQNKTSTVTYVFTGSQLAATNR
jgi:spore coat-associated protein N